MKNKLLFITLIIIAMFFILQINVNAASVPLGSVTADLSKEKIAPGEEVTVDIHFGTQLGAYTFDVAYDNSIFDFVSAEGGTENDNGTRIRVTYYDSSGGTNPRESMSVTFRAKASLESTNPTDFSITAEGLANADASQEYDDITTPIKKSITVEPNYVDYTIALNYDGNIIFNEEKEMELITSSSMGRNYDHVRMVVEVLEKPSDNATVKLLATERTRAEVDLITDGWGEPTGYELGGRDAEQILDIRGLFSEVGNYRIKVSLLDKDSSDAEIASQEFSISVSDNSVIDDENNNNNSGTGNENTGNNEENNNGSNNGNNNENNQNGNIENGNNTSINENGETSNDELPENLPKTGNTVYGYVFAVIAVLCTSYIVLKNNKKK